MKSTSLLQTDIGISILYLQLIVLGQTEIAWFMKPFLIPFLMLAVWKAAHFKTKKILITALFFSWIGDGVLLFADRAEIYFIIGLVSFLVSHLVYILLFTKQIKREKTKTTAVFWIGVTVIISYLMMMLFLLIPTLGDLKIAVFVYALVLSTMLLFAFKGFFLWKKKAAWSILIGAVIFVASDSILAFDKFYQKLELSSILIMSTYLLAQYLIVKGILMLNKNA